MKVLSESDSSREDATPRLNRVEVLWPDHGLHVNGLGHNLSVRHVLGLVHLCPVLAFGLVVLGLALHNACTCRAACRLGVDGAKWQGGDDDRRVAVARAGYLDVAAEEDALDFNTSLVANACRTAAAARRRSKGTEALNLHALRTRSGVRKRWCQQTRSSMKQDERQVKQQQDEKARGSAHIGTTKHHIATASNVGGADDCCIAAAAAGDESVHAAPAHGSCHARR